MKSTRGTRTLTIGELKLKVTGVDLAAQEVDRAIATEFDVVIEYSYFPGEPETVFCSIEDSHEGIPSEVEIKKIKADATVHFEGDNFSATAMRGTDLMPLLSGAQITALEDRIIDEIERERH